MGRQRVSPRPSFRRPTKVVEPIESEAPIADEANIKASAFWQGAYQGWFATALEQTKAVFTLSSAGVGLSLTLLFGSNVKPLASWAPIWLLLAAISFVAASCLGVSVFQVNKRVLETLVKGDDSDVDEAYVGRLDGAARSSFAIGLIFLILAGVSQIWM